MYASSSTFFVTYPLLKIIIYMEVNSQVFQLSSQPSPQVDSATREFIMVWDGLAYLGHSSPWSNIFLHLSRRKRVPRRPCWPGPGPSSPSGHCLLQLQALSGIFPRVPAPPLPACKGQARRGPAPLHCEASCSPGQWKSRVGKPKSCDLEGPVS